MQAPETDEMSLAALVLLPMPIASNVLLTPPRHVCSVAMFRPCAAACAVVLDNDPFVVASWPMVDAIEACREFRLAEVTASANPVTAT